MLRLNIVTCCLKYCPLAPVKRVAGETGLVRCVLQLPATRGSNVEQIRWSTSFFTRLNAEKIWKGVTSVSNAGRKKGRGKGRGRVTVKDFNKGQMIGVGKVNFIWPGLNAPVVRGREVVSLTKLAPNPDYETDLIKMRNEMDTFKKTSIHPLERGWSGRSLPGKWIGPPDAINEYQFNGFNTKVLRVINRVQMHSNFGRVKRIGCLTVTGNGNGLAGFGVGRGTDVKAVVKMAKNQAGQRIQQFNIFDGHTIFHDFYSSHGAIRIYAFKKPPGYGLKTNRVIEAICQCLGIKDIHCKIEGTVTAKRNYLSMVRAFFIGMENQKSYQQMADEKGLHVVEMRQDRDLFPVLMASPSSGRVRTDAEIGPEEILDFRMYLMDGRVIEPKIKKPPFYMNTPGYLRYLRHWHYWRSRQDVRVKLMAKYGTLDSFLTLREQKRRDAKRLKLVTEGTVEETA